MIDATHERMQEVYHPDGGQWKRGDMPRTSFVFLNDEEGLPRRAIRSRSGEAEQALGAYWNALEGTIDPTKVNRAANNALIGNVEEIAQQMVERFHPDDRIMAWFDFLQSRLRPGLPKHDGLHAEGGAPGGIHAGGA